MILITGGAFQGKGAFAKELAGQRNAAVIGPLDRMIAQMMREGTDPFLQMETIAKNNPDAVYTVCELGCGIVPVDAFDREWRENVGRISCMFAEKAQEVYRVLSGIPVRIK